MGNCFEFGETDGFNQGDYVVLVTPPNDQSIDMHYADTRFESNMIRASMLVRSNVAGIYIGGGTVGSDRIRHYVWNVGSIQPGSEEAVGIISYGSFDTFNFGVIGNSNMQKGLA